MPRPVGMATRDRGKFWNLSLLAELSFWAGLVLALPPAVSLQTCWTPARAGGQDQPRESGHTQPTYTHAYRHPQLYYKPTQTNTHAFAASCQSLPEQQNATDLWKLPQACCYCLFYISNLVFFLCGIWPFSFNLFSSNHLFSFFVAFSSFGSSFLSEETKPIYSQLLIDVSLLFNFSNFLIFLVSFSIFSVLYWFTGGWPCETWPRFPIMKLGYVQMITVYLKKTFKKTKLGFRLLERLNFRDFFFLL